MFLPKADKSYYYYVPAYAYAPHTMTTETVQKTVPNEQQPHKFQKMLEDSHSLLNFSHYTKSAPMQSQLFKSTTSSPSEASEPINLVGDEFLDDPFRKLLGRAITAHLYYPQAAAELHIRGIVSVGFVLHPSGDITNVKIIKKSRDRMLDDAALNAVTRASPIANVDLYVKYPKYLVVNIIF